MSNQFTNGWTEPEILYLRKMFIEGCSDGDIAEKIGRSKKSIQIKKHRLGLVKEDENERFKNKEWLYQKYVIEGLSTIDIAEMVGVRFSTIARWLKKFNIQARGFHEVTERQKKKIAEAGKRRTFEDHGCWKGGKTKTNEGYVYVKVKNHPYSNISSSVLEHRLVMEEFHGRYLKPHEVVHHINEIKDDNRVENLFVFYSGKDHSHYHGKIRKNPDFPMIYKYEYLHGEEESI